MDIILSRFCVLAYVLLFVFVFSARQANRLVGAAHSTGWWRTMPHVAGGGSRAGAGNRDLLGHATGFMQRCWYSLLLLLLLLLLHKTLPAPLLLPVSHLLEAWVKVVGWQGAAWRVGCILPAGCRHPHHRWRVFRAWQLQRELRIETHNGLQIQIHKELQLQTERGLQIHTQQQWTQKRGAEKLRTTEKALITLDLRKSLEKVQSFQTIQHWNRLSVKIHKMQNPSKLYLYICLI